MSTLTANTWFLFSIFGEIGEYDPTESTKAYEKREKARERDGERKRSKASGGYFAKSNTGEEEVR